MWSPTHDARFCRGISELALSKLDGRERKAAVVAALTAYKKFSFYPEQVRAPLSIAAECMYGT